MNRIKSTRKKSMLAMAGIAVLTLAPARAEPEKSDFKVEGVWIDSCSCGIPCGCEMAGVEHGCEGVGAFAFTGGSYRDGSLAGVKIVYATVPGEWVRIYLDVPDAKQRGTAEALARAILTPWGTIESVKDAKISLEGKAGAYVVAVDGGKILSLTTEPLLGADKKTPIVHSNVANPLNPTQLQARTMKAAFHDGPRTMKLENSNAYFNDRMQAQGEL